MCIRDRLKIEPAESDFIAVPDGKPGEKLYRHRFQALEFAGVRIANPAVVLWDKVTHTIRGLGNNGPYVTVALDGKTIDEFTLGLNTLSKLHIYVAVKEKKLYISPAGP